MRMGTWHVGIVITAGSLSTARPNAYLYTADLVALQACSSAQVPRLEFTESAVRTPLLHDAWVAALSSHPDRNFVTYICTGLRDGFRIGFARTAPLRSTSANMFSAVQHPEIIDEYISKELRLGRILATSCHPAIHINRFGVIPKGHNSGKWRLITDLSYPPGNSVNDGIDPKHCSLQYTTVEDVAGAAAKLGRGALMAKIDIEAAYRLVPVHPHDRPLLGMEWKGQIFVDLMLPFGLRSAPKIFNAIADALEWCIKTQGRVANVHHYLDDFAIIGSPGSDEIHKSLSTLQSVCTRLGVPLAKHKTEGPATRITFLGITIDTQAGQLSLPDEKLERLRFLLVSWGDHKVCTKKELESLVGILNHACKVIRPGRSFLRRMFDLLKQHGKAYHKIRLNREFRSDLQWWSIFSTSWNGVSYLSAQTTGEFSTDASGTWGCGAHYKDSWFQLQWEANTFHLPIVLKELLPIVVATIVWGSAWQAQKILCHCDNQAVVAVLRSRTSKHPHIMHMLRCLFFIEASYGFELASAYINSRANYLADDLSRNNLSSFLLKVPGASKIPVSIPAELLEILLDLSMDWTSPGWTQRFRAIFTTASPHRHIGHMTAR